MKKLRQANLDDTRFIVPLVAESSGGVWPAVWKALAKDAESTADSGLRYLTDTANDLSIKNTVVIELNGVRAGAMITYREARPAPAESGKNDSALPPDLSAALEPYGELSDPDSWFIAELCCLAETRGQGLGTQLLQRAQRDAAAQGLPRLSLRVFSENTGAQRLYQRFGFEVLDQRPVVTHPDITVKGSVLLMSCPL